MDDDRKPEKPHLGDSYMTMGFIVWALIISPLMLISMVFIDREDETATFSILLFAGLVLTAILVHQNR